MYVHIYVRINKIFLSLYEECKILPIAKFIKSINRVIDKLVYTGTTQKNSLSLFYLLIY